MSVPNETFLEVFKCDGVFNVWAIGPKFSCNSKNKNYAIKKLRKKFNIPKQVKLK